MSRSADKEKAPQRIKFVLQGITRTINANWSTDTTGSELEMKTKLRKGDYKTLNLYFQKVLRGGALGVRSRKLVTKEK